VTARDAVVVGVPIDSLGKPGGTELAPAALREAGIVEALGASDGGDLDVRIVGTERDPESGIVGYSTVVATCEGVRDGIAALLRDGAFPIVLGGCCTLVPGVAAALRTVDPVPAGMAYVDGHLDLYDGRTSPTGEAADLPLAIVAGHGDPALVALGPDVPMIEPRHIALLAHRDSEEARSYGSVMPADLGIAVSRDCAEVQAAGPAGVGREAAAALAGSAGRFWLSIDVDVMSDAAFPSTPVKQPGGLEADELVALARPLAQHPACAGLNLMCYDVEMDDAGRSSARVLVELARRLVSTSA
jgi:arginase